MSGMLPGVEFARRRRLHQGGGWLDSQATGAYASFRRSSLSSHSRNHDSHHNSAYSSSVGYEEDEKLGGLAREAKERLDERLRAQIKKSSGIIRRHDNSNRDSSRTTCDGRSELASGDQPIRGQVAAGLNRSGSKRFMSWSKLINWKDTEQEDCAVCLERFKKGETLMHLPCAHRFHSGCLVPWLESNSHCPCCRTSVPS